MGPALSGANSGYSYGDLELKSTGFTDDFITDPDGHIQWTITEIPSFITNSSIVIGQL